MYYVYIIIGLFCGLSPHLVWFCVCIDVQIQCCTHLCNMITPIPSPILATLSFPPPPPPSLDLIINTSIHRETKNPFDFISTSMSLCCVYTYNVQCTTSIHFWGKQWMTMTTKQAFCVFHWAVNQTNRGERSRSGVFSSNANIAIGV